MVSLKFVFIYRVEIEFIVGSVFCFLFNFKVYFIVSCSLRVSIYNVMFSVIGIFKL